MISGCERTKLGKRESNIWSDRAEGDYAYWEKRYRTKEKPSESPERVKNGDISFLGKTQSMGSWKQDIVVESLLKTLEVAC